MKVRVNIASVSTEASADVLAAAAKSPPGVSVYSTGDREVVGKTVAYAFIDPDLWADVELEDGTALAGTWMAAAIAMLPDGPAIAGVILTRLSRPMIEAAGHGLTHAQAVQFSGAKRGKS